MTLHTFKPEKTLLSRDLKELQLRAGGQAGSLKVGQEKVLALKMADNVFVTDQPVPKIVTTALAMARADVHRIQNRADLTVFLARWRAFERV